MALIFPHVGAHFDLFLLSYPVNPVSIQVITSVACSPSFRRSYRPVTSDLTPPPQHAAVSSPFVKRKPVAELLVRRGAALNEKNKELLTPLHVAIDCNHADSVELLLKHGAKVNALDSHGQTGQWGGGREVRVEGCGRGLQRYRCWIVAGATFGNAATPFFMRIDSFSFDFGLSQLVKSPSHWL